MLNRRKKTCWPSRCELGISLRHCEAGEGYWLQGEAALQAHSFRDADPQPVIQKKNGWNGLEIATNDRTCLEKSGHGRKCIWMTEHFFEWAGKGLEWPKRAGNSLKQRCCSAAPAAVNSYPAILLDICSSLSAIVQFGYQPICWESLDDAWQHYQCAKQDWAQLWVCVKMSPGALVLLWLLQARVTEPTVAGARAAGTREIYKC